MISIIIKCTDNFPKNSWNDNPGVTSALNHMLYATAPVAARGQNSLIPSFPSFELTPIKIFFQAFFAAKTKKKNGGGERRARATLRLYRAAPTGSSWMSTVDHKSKLNPGTFKLGHETYFCTPYFHYIKKSHAAFPFSCMHRKGHPEPESPRAHGLNWVGRGVKQVRSRYLPASWG